MSTSKKGIWWGIHCALGSFVCIVGMFLSVSGALYLFKDEVNGYLYHEYSYVGEQKSDVPPSIEELMRVASEKNEFGKIKKIVVRSEQNRTVEVHTTGTEGKQVLFIDPHTGYMKGKIHSETMLMNRVRKFHSELLLGTSGNLLVELVAVLMLFALFSGLINVKFRMGALRSKKFISGWRGRLVRGHVIFALAAFPLILFLLLSGLPWTGVFGKGLKSSLAYIGQGSPGFRGRFSVEPEDDSSMLPVSELLEMGSAISMKGDREFWLPKHSRDVFTVRNIVNYPEEQVWIRINPYDGSIVNSTDWTSFPLGAKILAWMMAIHEGRYFGIANKALGVFACFSIIIVSITSILMSAQRGREGMENSLRLANRFRSAVPGWAITFCGVLFPVFGGALLVVWSIGKTVTSLPCMSRNHSP